MAVVDYFLHLLPYVNATGDLADWTALSHPACQFCASVSEDVQSQTSAGRHDVGGSITTTGGTGTDVTPGGFYTVEFALVQAPSETVDASGAASESFDESKSAVSVAVVWDGTSWAIRGVETHNTP